jgi:hypothetical protein
LLGTRLADQLDLRPRYFGDHAGRQGEAKFASASIQLNSRPLDRLEFSSASIELRTGCCKVVALTLKSDNIGYHKVRG